MLIFPPVLPLERKQQRTEREQLVTLVNQWDPAGVVVSGAARHEYNDMVDKLYELLSGEPSEAEVVKLLETEVQERFGKAAPHAERFAAKVLTWSRLRAEEVSDTD